MASLGANTIAILIALGSFPVSLALTRFFMYWNAKHGIIGIDVHKLDRPKVPEMVGVAGSLAPRLLPAPLPSVRGGIMNPHVHFFSLVWFSSLTGGGGCGRP